MVTLTMPHATEMHNTSITELNAVQVKKSAQTLCTSPGASYVSSKEKEHVPVTLPARTGAPANYGAVNSAAQLKTPQPKRTQK